MKIAYDHSCQIHFKHRLAHGTCAHEFPNGIFYTTYPGVGTGTAVADTVKFFTLPEAGTAYAGR
ncbi:hypothetical protein GCM10027275_16320 [Rhabdobacter roseus]